MKTQTEKNRAERKVEIAIDKMIDLQDMGFYSENGERRFEQAWNILGIHPDVFGRGEYKKTSDGMLTPKAISKWLSN